MVAFSDDLPILWRINQQHRMRGTGPVSMKTAKSQCEFFNLNSRRRRLIMTSGFSTLKSQNKKINVATLCVRLSSTNML